MRYMTNRSRAVSVTLLAVWTLVGCSNAHDSPLTPAPVPSPKQVAADSTVLTRPARPLTVSVSLDQTRSVRAYVTTDGGTVSATGADGTRYTLEIPKDALLEAQYITLTPVAETGGKPIGSNGPAAAVQFEPEGLRFLTPATLRIDPAKPIPLEQQVGLGWHGAGQETHLEPLDPSSANIVMHIAHFSGVGVGMVYLGDNNWGPSADFREVTPQEFEDRANQYISQLLAEERQRELSGKEADPQVWQTVSEVLRQEWVVVIKPMLDRAMQDCDYAEANMSKVTGFGHTVALLGIDDIASSIWTGYGAAIENCWKEQKGKCRMVDDVARLQQILQVARMEQLLGGSANLNDIPICGSGYTGTFQATVVATPEGATMTITGSVMFTRDSVDGSREYFRPSSGTVSWTISGPYAGGCTVSGSGTVAVKPTDGTLQVIHGLDGMAHYTGSGATNFFDNLNVTCAGKQVTIPEAGRITWFNPPLGLITAPGSGSQLTGSREDASGKWSWNLQVQ